MTTPLPSDVGPPIVPPGAGLILMYHRVGDGGADPWALCVSPQHFAQHLEVLRRRSRSMRVRDLVTMVGDGSLPTGASVVTFDDGYADNLGNARALLERHDIPATVFLATGQIGRPREFWWDELERILLEPGVLPATLEISLKGRRYEWSLEGATDYPEPEARRHRHWRFRDDPPTERHRLYRVLWELLRALPGGERLAAMDALFAWAGFSPDARSSHRPLKADEVAELAAGDLVEIGAHTVTHPLLPTLSPAEQATEVQASRASAEHLVGRPVISFAYPYGAHETETRSIVRELGFLSACSTKPGPVSVTSDLFALPRLHIEDWDGEELERRLAGALSG